MTPTDAAARERAEAHLSPWCRREDSWESLIDLVLTFATAECERAGGEERERWITYATERSESDDAFTRRAQGNVVKPNQWDKMIAALRHPPSPTPGG